MGYSEQVESYLVSDSKFERAHLTTIRNSSVIVFRFLTKMFPFRGTGGAQVYDSTLSHVHMFPSS